MNVENPNALRYSPARLKLLGYELYRGHRVPGSFWHWHLVYNDKSLFQFYAHSGNDAWWTASRYLARHWWRTFQNTN